MNCNEIFRIRDRSARNFVVIHLAAHCHEFRQILKRKEGRR
jgi:hypothetical protein